MDVSFRVIGRVIPCHWTCHSVSLDVSFRVIQVARRTWLGCEHLIGALLQLLQIVKGRRCHFAHSGVCHHICSPRRLRPATSFSPPIHLLTGTNPTPSSLPLSNSSAAIPASTAGIRPPSLAATSATRYVCGVLPRKPLTSNMTPPSSLPTLPTSQENARASAV